MNIHRQPVTRTARNACESTVNELPQCAHDSIRWKTQRGGFVAGTTSTVSPPVFPRSPVAPVFPVLPVAPVSPVDPGAPVMPVDPVFPVNPGAPVGPAGPGVVTVTAGVGVTGAGLLHAPSASAISTDENAIEYFMWNSFQMVR